jgi:uncharacterized protein YkwD
MQAMLDIINQTRAQNGVGAVGLSTTESNGTSTCAGSIGHSEAMAQSGQIWHQNSAYPQASWPNDICVSITAAGENVGAFGGDEMTALRSMHAEMMSEPHTPGCQGSHACNILDPRFNQVGIGIYVYNGQTWLTEDFVQSNDR